MVGITINHKKFQVVKNKKQFEKSKWTILHVQKTYLSCIIPIRKIYTNLGKKRRLLDPI